MDPDDVVEAAGHDAFYGSRLEAELTAARRDVVLLAGFGLETTVESTARTAVALGHRCVVLSDLVASLDPAVGRGRLRSFGHFGIDATRSDLVLGQHQDRRSMA